jgi:hypothetical protein
VVLVVVILTGMVEMMGRFWHPFTPRVLLAISCGVVEI